VTFKVPDLAVVWRRAETRGYDIVGRDESDLSWKEAFLHPRQALGIVVQLVESGSAPPRDPPAVIQPGLPPPARILGLGLRAHSPGRAITQWRGVLQGEMGETPEGSLVFRWSDSPLRLVVDVDATAPEGPTAIEIASEGVVTSLDGASARLGIRLTRRQGGD
jgi:hypothetical protein